MGDKSKVKLKHMFYAKAFVEASTMTIVVGRVEKLDVRGSG